MVKEPYIYILGTATNMTNMKLGERMLEINSSKWIAGIYAVEIYSGDKTIYKKIVKN